MTTEQRFWAKVDTSGECWLWTAARTFGGRYGGFKLGGRVQPAHRVAYQLLVGSIPAGLELDHLCRTTLCVNPAHLEPVTHKENVRRGANVTRTHCLRGHAEPLVPVYRGRRECRACRAENNRAYRQRRAAA